MLTPQAHPDIRALAGSASPNVTYDLPDRIPASECSPMSSVSSSQPDAHSHFTKTPGTEPIPGYVLLEPLGRGGFGEVWKCEAPGGLLKAVKFVRGDTLSVGRDPAHDEM